jgi:hypothetical protein
VGSRPSPTSRQENADHDGRDPYRKTPISAAEVLNAHRKGKNDRRLTTLASQPGVFPSSDLQAAINRFNREPNPSSGKPTPTKPSRQAVFETCSLSGPFTRCKLTTDGIPQ